MLGDELRISEETFLRSVAHLSTDERLRLSLIRALVRHPDVLLMSAAGMITLPGIMTGQILAGADPIEAVKYQVLLMFLLAGQADCRHS